MYALRLIVSVVSILVLALPEAPRSETYRDSVLTVDTLWRDQVTVDGMVMIAPQATLSIRPGTRITFSGYSSPLSRAGIVVEGRIDAAGLPDAPIEFSVAGLGEWAGITIMGSSKNNRLESFAIRGAAAPLRIIRSTVQITDPLIEGGGNGIEMIDSTVTIRGGWIGKAETGIVADGGDLTIRGGVIAENSIGISARRGALTCRGTRFTGNRRRALFLAHSHFLVEESRFDLNRIAAAFDGGEGLFVSNRVETSGGDAVHVANSRVSIVGNLFSRNAGNALSLRDGLATVTRNVFEGGDSHDLVNLGSAPLHLPGNWWPGGMDPHVRGRLGGVGPIDVRPILTERPPISDGSKR